MDGASNLVLVGPMGSGKSVVGALLARRFGLPFVDLDQEIAREAGAGIPELFRRDGEAAFREREAAVLERCLDADGRVLATGGGAILDAASRGRLRERGVVAWLQADPETQLERLERCADRPLLDTPDRIARLRELAAQRDPLYAGVADLAVDTRGLDPVAVAAAVAASATGRWHAAGSAA
jgi:shikimate kinase